MIESDSYISFSQGSYSAVSMSSKFEMSDHMITEMYMYVRVEVRIVWNELGSIPSWLTKCLIVVSA